MLRANDRHFWILIVAFAVIFLGFYPSTYAIEDEFSILSLSTALSRGTVFLDRAGLDLDADLVWNGHTISKFSPFHAALFVPALAIGWKSAFAITALFTIVGAFVFRGMLRREGLPPGLVVLYFLCAGLWFYSRTLMAAVPASVMVLVGASLLLRKDSRPAAAGAALSVACLFHPWMIPVSAALTLGWWLDAPRHRLPLVMMLVAAATPGAGLLLLYNAVTTGSPFQNGYSLLGTQYGFAGENIVTFFPLYVGSLLLMPLCGWVALSPRWSDGMAIPLTVGTVIAMGSLYYFRDGIGYGVAGVLPAQRFLLPASLLACLPAARFLADRLGRAASWMTTAGAVCFVVGFVAVSLGHGAYLDAHASVQASIRASIPDGARILAGERVFKELAPVVGNWRIQQLRDGRVPDTHELERAYSIWIGPPGSHPPPEWFDNLTATKMAARSWVWNRDVWMAEPSRVGNLP